jgi:5-hydroxyisourate hydrolase
MLSTHVLDVAAGHPAAGIAVSAERWDDRWVPVGTGTTDGDGRIAALVVAGDWSAGRWRISFDVAAYLGAGTFLRTATIELDVASADRLHLPLLLSPFGFTTYRGS